MEEEIRYEVQYMAGQNWVPVVDYSTRDLAVDRAHRCLEWGWKSARVIEVRSYRREVWPVKHQ